MITILTDICNPISQDFYDNQVNNLQLHKLTCPCGHSGCLSIHGYYKRKIKSGPFIIRLRIRRMICALCKATHALLLSSMVPYSQIPFQQHVEILIARSSTREGKPSSTCGDCRPRRSWTLTQMGPARVESMVKKWNC